MRCFNCNHRQRFGVLRCNLAAGLLAAGVLGLLAGPPAQAQDGAAETMSVLVKKVQGLVQVRAKEDGQWQRAEVGMELTQGAEFRTGLGSRVEFTVGADQTVAVDRLTTVKVLQAIQQAGKVKMDLGMKYGRTRYRIEAGGLEHESTIRSPSAVLAVRGTDVGLQDESGFRAQARWNKKGPTTPGRAKPATFTGSDGQPVTFGGADQAAHVDDGSDGAAGTAMQQTVVHGAGWASRTDVEAQLATRRGLSGALLDAADVVADVQDQQDAAERIGNAWTNPFPFHAFQADLTIQLRWQTPYADLDMFVDTMLSNGVVEHLSAYPVPGHGPSSDVVGSGGWADQDHTGGATGGVETATWLGVVPAADFTFGARHFPNDPAAPAVPYDITVRLHKPGQPEVVRTFQGALDPDTIAEHNLRIDPGLSN